MMTLREQTPASSCEDPVPARIALSGPPEPWLFTEALRLTFTAEQYEQGRTPEYEYEPSLIRATANRAPHQIFNTPDPAAASDHVLGEGGDVKLDISGDKVAWSRKKEAAAAKQ
jgi:hypothetical protein